MRKQSAVPPSHGGWPAWYDGKNINEVLFCEEFLAAHPMKCIRGRLFTVDGAVEDEAVVSQQILETVSGCVTSGLSKLVSNLLASIKLQAYSPLLPIETDRIHVANGTYFMDGRFSPEKTYCNNRLAVGYLPDAPRPERWLRFLSELLEPEDIPTLQEYLGYCLLPTTRAQKMLLIIGRGGEGKSRIGLVMRAILGDSMNTTSIQKVENNRFSRADLEHKLLMVDDDMDLSALPKTNYIKSIVTSECKMDLERKGVQSYQSLLYVRFLCFGNGALTALHDQSDGFFRRQIGRAFSCGAWRGCTVSLPRTTALQSAPRPRRMWKRCGAAATTWWSFCSRRVTSASVRTMRPVPSPFMRHTRCGARTMCASPCRPTASARS